MTRRTAHEVRGSARTKGEEIVAGFRELAETLRTGEPLEARFTVRTYRIAVPPKYSGEDVAQGPRSAGNEPGRLRGVSRRGSVHGAFLGAKSPIAEHAGLSHTLGDRGEPDPLAQSARGMPH